MEMSWFGQWDGFILHRLWHPKTLKNQIIGLTAIPKQLSPLKRLPLSNPSNGPVSLKSGRETLK
jgi:hypothetical protein